MSSGRRWIRPILCAGLAVGLAGLGVLYMKRTRPTDPLTLGRAAYERGDWASATRFAQERTKQAPDDRDALRLLARAYARLERDEAAQRIFVRLGPETWQAEDFFLLSSGFRRQGRHELARATLLNARKADPAHPEALEQLALLSLGAGRPIEAAGLARLLADLPRSGSRGNLLLARALEEQDDPAAAADVLMREIGKAPGQTASGLHRQLATDLLRVGRAVEARRQLERAGSPEGDAEGAWLLSRACLQAGDFIQAERALSRAGGYAKDDALHREPAPYVGASRCAECHATIHREQQASRHAATLASRPGIPEPDPKGKPLADPASPGVSHVLSRDEDELAFVTTAAGKARRALVEFVLGSGDRGQTYIGVDESGKTRELRLSRYCRGTVWDLTPGQIPRPGDPADLIGRPVDDDELRRCLGCHTTRVIREGGRLLPDPVDRGIGCERCHGPGGHHLRAVESKFSELAIARPKLAPAARVVQLCGGCHGPPEDMVMTSGLGTVRFQAPSLVLSRCYTETPGGLSCLACHSPHKDAETSASFYEGKCLSCHSTSKPDRGKACSVNPTSGCLSCHMPRSEDASRHTTFTDHHIRIRRAVGR
jgi:Flp pilus assembly protein TadD